MFDAGQFPQCVGLCQQALQIENNNPYLLYLLSQSLFKLNDFPSAVSCLDQSFACLALPRDEVLLPQLSRLGIEIGNMLMSVPGQRKVQEQGMQMKLRHTAEMVGFLER